VGRLSTSFLPPSPDRFIEWGGADTIRAYGKSPVKKLLITLLKVGISVAIIGWLVRDAMKPKGGVNVFANFVEQPKDWGMLAAAWAFCVVGTLLTFVRWWYLVRALEIPCRFGDAIRISFWGYLFNILALVGGILGGDLVKAVMLAHEQHGHRARAVASVFVDRIIGLYMLFVVASAAILLTGFWDIEVAEIRWICTATFWITGVGAAGILVMLTPGITDGRGSRALARIPRVGPIIEHLLVAVRMYRRQPGILALSAVMTIGVHCSFAAGFYLIARGLPGGVLAASDYFVIMPLSSATGAIPLAFGPFETVVCLFYNQVPAPAGVVILPGQGLLLALVYRLISVLIAALGVYYYFGNRRELAEVIHEAEEEDETPGATEPSAPKVS
jgi:hypothetical protein